MMQPAKASEPSMEEILASIRRIIADDDTTKLAQPEPEASTIAASALDPAVPAAAGDAAEQQSADSREFSEQMAAAASPPGGATDAGFADIAEKSAARRKPDEAQLLSPESSAAVESAFATLSQAVLVRNARTLEDLVGELLRPMLKSWLDENLPRLVERLVRAEIERLSRGH